jgi:hypothetical protein
LKIQSCQLEQIAELWKDVDALLSVLDHWVTSGAGDEQRQFEYMAKIQNGQSHDCDWPLSWVGDTGIEPVTSSV